MENIKDKAYTDISGFDEKDPNPWLALYLDSSIPINPKTKLALMRDNNSRSVKYILPLVGVWSKVMVFLIHIFKYFFPKVFNSSRVLHKILASGLKRFVSPDANLLIFRHFHVGSEILKFIAANIQDVELTTSPLLPKTFEDVKDDIFLKHDLNLYNFVIKLNNQLQEKGLDIKPREQLDLSMITDDQFDHQVFPSGRLNKLDLRSAIEVFMPFYQFFLSYNDFIRASNSLQLDETIAIYTSKILGSPAHLSLINNRHPMVPLSTYSAAYRLVLHGLSAETLHSILVHIKQGSFKDGVILTKELKKIL